MANGKLTPSPDTYKKMLYEKGQSAAPGDRVVITAMDIKADRIILDLNGGPYAKHRFLRHIQLNDAPMPIAGDPLKWQPAPASRSSSKAASLKSPARRSKRSWNRSSTLA